MKIISSSQEFTPLEACVIVGCIDGEPTILRRCSELEHDRILSLVGQAYLLGMTALDISRPVPEIAAAVLEYSRFPTAGQRDVSA